MDRYELRRLDYSLSDDHEAIQSAYREFFKTHCPIETVRALVCCEVGVTDAMADDLARAFGTSAALWRNLQATYDRASG